MHRKIGAINGLRGLAILGVVWHHLFSAGVTPPGAHSVELWNFKFLPLTMLSNGWLGVNLFFMLSGFVLFYPFVLNRRKMASWSDCGRFYLRRFLRLMPLFYFSLVVLIAIDFADSGHVPEMQHLLLYFTATFNFNAETFFPSVNWVLWSLGIEVWFSILFPLLLVGSYRFGISRLLLAVLVLSLTVRVLGNQEVGQDVYLGAIKDGLFGRLDDFLVGMWLCHLFCNPPEWRISSLGLLATGVVAILVVCSVWDHTVLGTMPLAVRPFLNNLLQFGAGCIIYSLLIADHSRVAGWFLNRELQILGLMTYSIYIWHGRLISLVGDVSGMSVWAAILPVTLYLLALLAISVTTYRFIEFWHVKEYRSLFNTST